MRKSIVAKIVLLNVLVISSALAQDAFTEEQLTDFVKMEMEVADFQNGKMTEYKEWKTTYVKAEFGKVSRYNAISKAGSDETKLAELNLTEKETAAFKSIKEKEKALKEAIRSLKIDKIKGEDGIGAGVYNKITNALKTNEEVKAQYTKIREQLLAEKELANNDSAEGETN